MDLPSVATEPEPTTRSESALVSPSGKGITTFTALGDVVRRRDRPSHTPPPTTRAAATPDHTNVRRLVLSGTSLTAVCSGSGSAETDAAATGGGITSGTTSPINRYPCFGKVSINFGFEALSFNTERICRTQKFKLWSRSTFTPFPH